MSSMNNVKKRIIISMFAIVLLILTLFGITYAYFTAKVNENEKNESIKISAASLELAYDGKDSYVKIENLKPGEKIAEKTFSVTNNGSREVKNYDVILENLVNELNNYEDLTYTLTCKSSDDNDCKGSEGIFPKNNQVIVTNTINSKVTHTYKLILNYEETGKNQSIDMNKEVSAKVNIKHDISSIKTFKIYGNSEQIGIPTINEPIEIESLGYKSKNLLNPIFSTNLWSNAGSGVQINSDTSGYSQIIKVKPNTSYTISGINTGMNGNYMRITYTEEYPAVGVTTVAERQVFQANEYKSITITTPNNCNYLLLMTGTSSVNDYTNNKLQLEEGEVATNYEPYGYIIPIKVINDSNEEKIYNVYLDEPLRKLGDVSDYLDLENRIVVRNVGEKIFDGTETMYTYENGVYYGLLHNPNITGISNYFSNNSNNIPYLKTNVNENAIHFVTDNTVEEFKSLLTTNYNNNKPVKVLYGLNKNTFESINVPVFDVDATKTINVCSKNNICASNIEVEYDE